MRSCNILTNTQYYISLLSLILVDVSLQYNWIRSLLGKVVQNNCLCMCVRANIWQFTSPEHWNVKISDYVHAVHGFSTKPYRRRAKKNIIIQFSRIFQTPGDHSDNLRAYTRGHWCHSSAIKMLFNRVIRGKYMLYTSFRTRKTSSSMWHNLNSNQQHWP